MNTPWWNPDRHQDRRPFLLARQSIKSSIRNWFMDQGFLEVETSCLQISPGNEAHLHAFATERLETDLTSTQMFLHTSPEFAMKKLLAAGENKIMSLGPVFRNREAGHLHLPEFQMLEWYRAGTNYTSIMDDAIEVLRLACKTTNVKAVSWRGRFCDIREAPERLTVTDAFARHAGIDLQAGAEDRYNDAARPHLADQATATGLTIADDDDWSDVFSKCLTAHIEPKLGIGRPTLLYDYPLREAALAAPKDDQPTVAERFELYCCGIELANGFTELTDAATQRQRFEAEMAVKQHRYGERYPLDEDFLRALEMMPAAAGAALGFDRLVMLAAGADRVQQVVWTPPEDAHRALPP